MNPPKMVDSSQDSSSLAPCKLDSVLQPLAMLCHQNFGTEGVKAEEQINQEFTSETRTNRYVGFLDLLGFGAKVKNNFHEAVQTYREIIIQTNGFGYLDPAQCSIRVYSDAFLVTATKLCSVVSVTRTLHKIAAQNGYLIRGGISCGNHIELNQSGNLFIVSSALVKAVELEKRLSGSRCSKDNSSVERPIVEVDRNIMVDLKMESTPHGSNLDKPVLFYKDKYIVNPCTPIDWGCEDASKTISGLRSKAPPEFHKKYDALLDLIAAISLSKPLIPFDIWNSTASPQKTPTSNPQKPE